MPLNQVAWLVARARSRHRGLLGLAILAATSAANAGVLQLAVNPATPSEDEALEVTYNLDSCGDRFRFYSPSNRSVEIVGSVFRVVVPFERHFCFPGQFYIPAYDWSIGPFPPGDYVIELRGYLLENGPSTTSLLATADVTIAQGAVIAPSPAVIPATNTLGAAALLALMLFGGFVSIGMKRL